MQRLLWAVLITTLLSLGSISPAAAAGVPHVRDVPADSAVVTRWQPLINGVSHDMGVPADLIARVMWVESRGNPWAYSREGGIGLMQTMGFHWFAGEHPWDPYENVRKGTGILLQNYRRYGNWIDAVRWYYGATGNYYVSLVFRFD